MIFEISNQRKCIQDTKRRFQEERIKEIEKVIEELKKETAQ